MQLNNVLGVPGRKLMSKAPTGSRVVGSATPGLLGLVIAPSGDCPPKNSRVLSCGLGRVAGSQLPGALKQRRRGTYETSH